MGEEGEKENFQGRQAKDGTYFFTCMVVTASVAKKGTATWGGRWRWHLLRVEGRWHRKGRSF